MKILFVGATVHPCVSATGKMTLAVAKSLTRDGHEVHCVDELYRADHNKTIVIDGIFAHTKPQKPKKINAESNVEAIQPSKGLKAFLREAPVLGKLYFGLYKVKHAIVSLPSLLSNLKENRRLSKENKSLAKYYGKIYKTPYMYDKYQPNVYLNAITDLNDKHQFDAIVAQVVPFTSMVAVYWFKEKHPETPILVYAVDAISDIGAYMGFSAEYMEQAGFEWEKRVYPHCAGIIEMASHREHYSAPPFNMFAEKMHYADPPFLIENNSSPSSYFSKEHTNLLYTGAINNSFVPFEVSLEFFSKLRNSCNIKYCIFGFGEDIPMVKNYTASSGGSIHYGGRLNSEDVPIFQKNADILVSVGTNGSKQITSKIFEYMATGNKIVHFSIDPQDVCIPYYEKYPNVLVLRVSDSFETNAAKFSDFLIQPKTDISFEAIQKLFPAAVPDFTAALIEKILATPENLACNSRRSVL
ncbi:hypothetical protein FACS1894217_00810 [Clostridia bacterium]|nr:hypothetical protein FACS1894217_00810 [Clostridia bacterium]